MQNRAERTPLSATVFSSLPAAILPYDTATKAAAAAYPRGVERATPAVRYILYGRVRNNDRIVCPVPSRLLQRRHHRRRRLPYSGVERRRRALREVQAAHPCCSCLSSLTKHRRSSRVHAAETSEKRTEDRKHEIAPDIALGFSTRVRCLFIEHPRAVSRAGAQCGGRGQTGRNEAGMWVTSGTSLEKRSTVICTMRWGAKHGRANHGIQWDSSQPHQATHRDHNTQGCKHIPHTTRIGSRDQFSCQSFPGARLHRLLRGGSTSGQAKSRLTS